MRNSVKLCVAALSALCVVLSIITLVRMNATSSDTQPTRYAHLASTTKKVIHPTPTSEAVPFPACTKHYINLSQDDTYPVPHWIHSLPDHADKALVLAIAKNESRFKPYARSHRGAVGLMQLMPNTARAMVKKHGDPLLHLASAEEGASAHTPQSPFDFGDPYVSLSIGHRYIEYLQERPYIRDNITYTLAAYNAGPANLRKWKRRYGHLSQEAFAAHIPFRETRNYVRKVLRDYHRYQSIIVPIKETVWLSGQQC